MSRGAAKEIITRRLYQRSQILTWPHGQKAQFLEQYGIRWVVNFWHKVDPDLSGLVDGYLYLPVRPATRMTELSVEAAAQFFAQQIAAPGPAGLVLCESGVTRSVFFCALVVRHLLSVDGATALSKVTESVGRTKVHAPLVEHLRGLPAPGTLPPASGLPATEGRLF